MIIEHSAREGGGGLLDFLPTQVREPQRPLLALAIAWLLTFPLSIALAAVVSALAPNATQPEFPFQGTDLFLRLVILAPVLETLLMGLLLSILSQFVRASWAVAITAAVAGLAHSFASNGVLIWGLVIWWPFLIFSILFVTWRRRGLLAAFAVPAIAHSLHNLPTATLVAYFPNLI